MNRVLTTRMQLKNFVKETVPYKAKIEEDFDDSAILLNINFPWWSWKVPCFARENKVIINRVKRQVKKYGTAYVEYRVEYHRPL